MDVVVVAAVVMMFVFKDTKVWFVFLFNGISTFEGYLMPMPFSKKNSSSTI